MKFTVCASEEITRALAELSGKFGFECGEGGLPVKIELGGSNLFAEMKDGTLLLRAPKKVQIFYALKEVSDEEEIGEGYSLKRTPAFENLTYMLDCSRNAVPLMDTVYELIRHLAVLGYDSLGLYMEDTFKLDNHPYFGYLRTPFSHDELRAADEYSKLFGIELVPYIQTLAHFNSLIRHYACDYLFDVNDILLVGEDKTYEFIEDIIATCASCFTSRHINIGMDEAYMLGRGRYMDKNGAKSRFEIMSQHLARVNEICKKYNFEPAMWSDMFFSLTLSGQYAQGLPPEVLASVPENIELVYWDYYHTNEEHYSEMLDKHLEFKNKIGFASGAWKWLGYTPDNRYSFVSSMMAARACKKRNIKDFIVTGWGDNGADCSVFATLPALLYCSRLNYGKEKTDAAFKKSLLSLTGMRYDDFMTVDLCNRVTTSDDVDEKNSVNKYMLFNDVLLGTLDTTIGRGTNDLFKDHTRKLARAKKRAGKWAYLFETQYCLSRVLEIKTEIGIMLREAYQKGDREGLSFAYEQLKKLPVRIEAFYRAIRAQWHKENRPNGFDVQDIRIGALKQRVAVAIEKVGDYLNGRAQSVPELGEKLLDHMGHGDDFEVDPDQCEWRWRRMTSVNVNE